MAFFEGQYVGGSFTFISLSFWAAFGSIVGDMVYQLLD